ncbi:MAG: protease modulator HflC [Desulfobacterales bacterium]|nr:MAG: protease modulator HflC [Desulfobacterales bacterium]
MGQKIGPILLIISLLLIALYASFYVVDQTEQAILIQLGEPIDGTIGPGLHIKIPIIQKVIFFDNRLLDYNATPFEILSADKKNIKVDNYAKWRIADPLKFYESVRDIGGALARLGDTIDSEIRTELGRYAMIDILSKPRSELLEAVRKRCNEWAQNYGIDVIDVRIKRIDLPPENQHAVFARMRAERDRQAKKYRSEGQQEALGIRAAADRERTIILADAYRKAQAIKGQGDAEAARIYAEAFGQDPEFFELIRTLEASRTALDDKTIMVISPEYEFLQFLKKSGARLGRD